MKLGAVESSELTHWDVDKQLLGADKLPFSLKLSTIQVNRYDLSNSSGHSSCFSSLSFEERRLARVMISFSKLRMQHILSDFAPLTNYCSGSNMRNIKVKKTVQKI